MDWRVDRSFGGWFYWRTPLVISQWRYIVAGRGSAVIYEYFTTTPATIINNMRQMMGLPGAAQRMYSPSYNRNMPSNIKTASWPREIAFPNGGALIIYRQHSTYPVSRTRALPVYSLYPPTPPTTASIRILNGVSQIIPRQKIARMVGCTCNDNHHHPTQKVERII